MARQIVVHGAGSIGCYLGGALTAAGAQVTLLGRPSLAAEVHTNGLRGTDWRGGEFRLPPDRINFATDTAVLADADLILVTVKSLATEQAAAEIGARARPGAPVVSFQNGISNIGLLRKLLPAHTVLAGMVQFNVVHAGPGHWHRATEGELGVEEHAGLMPWLAQFTAAGLPLTLHGDMAGIQWGKLLLNLNNAVVALANVPLKEELEQRSYRRCLAMCIGEALQVLRAAGIKPSRVSKAPPHLLPRVLALPDWLFSRIAGAMLKVDPTARSSMWEDLERGRRTEIDYLNGEIVRLAESMRLSAPVNGKIVELVRNAERGGRRDWKADELLGALRKPLRV